MPIYVGFYTKNTPYEKEAEMLSQTLDSFNLPYKIYAIESRGNWLKNALAKPEIILNAWHEFSESIVYLDVDARVLKKPELFESLKNCDFAVHIRDRAGLSFFTSTMYFNKTPSSFKLLEDWKARCQKGEKAISRRLPPPYYQVNTDEWAVADQGPLVNAYLAMKDKGEKIDVFPLPKSYAVKYNSKHTERVILQTQKSKDYHKFIK